ncbi:MAG: heat-inducible transcriptional repressor HrcA [Bacillota bacterium]
MVDEIKERKKKILKAIIRKHILSAKPVGSRSLAKSYDFGISPATIRNEMADLEDMGYLKQPHTSAGRIPSDKGYRFYVDVLMDQSEVSSTQLKESLREFYKEKKGIEGIISGMVNMLSRLTRYTTMISEPELDKSKIKKVELIRVARKTLLIVFITDTGIVNNKIIKLEEDLSQDQLKQISRYLLKRLQNKTLMDLDDKFISQIAQDLMKRVNLSQRLFEIINGELNKIGKSTNIRVFLGGTSYILDQPEFNDINVLKKVLKMLDHEENLRKLVQNLPEDDLEVKIGHENSLDEMKNCSIVCATYHLGNKAIGKIGVIGPTRMEYPRVISTVDIAADILGKIISQGND